MEEKRDKGKTGRKGREDSGREEEKIDGGNRTEGAGRSVEGKGEKGRRRKVGHL